MSTTHRSRPMHMPHPDKTWRGGLTRCGKTLTKVSHTDAAHHATCSQCQQHHARKL